MKGFLSFLLVMNAFMVVGQSLINSAFGENFEYDDYMYVGEAMKKNKGEEICIRGTVNAVCQVKGCWMTLVDGQGQDAIFVKFKDYSFFMPLDLAGKEVIAKGLLTKEVTPVEELRHYAEDEGLSKQEIDAITEPKEEFKMMASGVVILN